MNDPLYYLTGVLCLGVAAQWIASRLKFPSILLLLALGFIAGNFVETDKIIKEDLLLAVVSLSVAVILFEGGLTLKVGELIDSGKVTLRLCSVGAVITWILSTISLHYLVGLIWPLATLIGAILIVTGPTVIAPILRTVRPEKKIASIVKWEGIVIDPIGAVLALLVYEAIIAGGFREASIETLIGLGKTLLVGSLTSIITGMLLIQLLKRFWISDYLHNAVILAAVIGSFTISNYWQHESGLVTVTLLGIIMANQKSVSVRHVVEFKENLQVLLISGLFIVLASRLRWQQLEMLGLGGLGFLVLLILIVRPASVFIATIRTDLNLREKLFLAFLAPRGIVAAAVTSVFALKLSLLGDGSAHANALSPQLLSSIDSQVAQLVPLTFLVIVGTVTIYGLLAAPLARMLGLADSNPQGILFAGAAAWIRDFAKLIQDEGHHVLLVDTNYANISRARMQGLPTHCASILSEYAHEELELSGIGRFLALTPNREVNSLSTLEFQHLFGRANVYQLSSNPESESARATVAGHLKGRILFDEPYTYDYFENRYRKGAIIKKTNLSEEFTFEDFKNQYQGEVVILATIKPNGELKINTTEDNQTVEHTGAVIAMVDAAEENL